MRFPMHSGKLALLLTVCLCACGPRPAPRPPGGPWGMMDFMQTYNAYALAQTYRERGQYAEAIVEYEQSLQRFARLDETARRQLRDEYGLSQEQIERELAMARANIN
mgnify:CR=1 FL=1